MRTLLAAATIALALTGCSGSPEAESKPDAPAPSAAPQDKPSLEQALLSDTNIPQPMAADEEQKPTTGSFSGPGLGCLNTSGISSMPIATETVSKRWSSDTPGTWPSLTAQIYRYETPDQAIKTLNGFVSFSAKCKQITQPAGEGATMKLKVTTAKVGNRVATNLIGGITDGKRTLPMAMHFATIQQGQHIITIIYNENSSDSRKGGQAFANAQAARLAAVLAGKEPNDAVVKAPINLFAGYPTN